MAQNIVRIETDWIDSNAGEIPAIVQLRNNALLVAQSARLDWFDLFVAIGQDSIFTREISVRKGEMKTEWRTRGMGRQQFRITISVPFESMSLAGQESMPTLPLLGFSKIGVN